MLAPHQLFNNCSSFVPVQPISGVINKDCTEAEFCILPSAGISVEILTC